MGRVIAGVGVHRTRLQQLVTTGQGPVCIASAYVTDTGLFPDDTSRDVRLLTALSTMDLISGATSLEALETLIRRGVRCRYLSNDPRLHAKVYIFGRALALVTSANLTERALNSNIEVGIQVIGGDVGELTRWFDGLWESAEALDAHRLSTLRQRTAGLRSEFSCLRELCRQLDRTDARSDSAAEAADSQVGSSLRYFLCNTDRKHGTFSRSGGYEPEESMRARRYAAAWEEFKHTSHMKKVNRGDIIFMYANGAGIIGIGKAVGACESLEPGTPGMVFEEESGREWRVPVEWLGWVAEGQACPWAGPRRTTFEDTSAPEWSGRRNAVIRHFFRDSEVVHDGGLKARASRNKPKREVPAD